MVLKLFKVTHAQYIAYSFTFLVCVSTPGTVFFFFFYWHYNPLWVLAFSVILFHSTLSSHRSLHRLIPIICVSSSISTIHLFLGLHLILVPRGFHSNIILGVLLLSIRITWPNQVILLLFISLLSSTETNTMAVRKVFSHFEYLKNRSRGLGVTWQPVRGDLTVHPWTVILP